MSVAVGLYDALRNNAGVSALVGTRIYPLVLPDNPTYPAISYQRISNGPQLGSTTLRQARYQINCWDDDYAGAQAVAAAVKTALEEYSDNGSPQIKYATIINELDDYDPDALVYRAIIDVGMYTLGD